MRPHLHCAELFSSPYYRMDIDLLVTLEKNDKNIRGLRYLPYNDKLRHLKSGRYIFEKEIDRNSFTNSVVEL